MNICNGFKDWLECLKCPYLCSRTCPLENENVVEEMRRQIRFYHESEPAGPNASQRDSDKT
jgi:hypothetical protein